MEESLGKKPWKEIKKGKIDESRGKTKVREEEKEEDVFCTVQHRTHRVLELK